VTSPAPATPGSLLWVERYRGPGHVNSANSVAVSPGGGTVFVTGVSTGTTSGGDYATVAYDAATGTQRWAETYNGPANGYDVASTVAISPNGSTVYVTGSSSGTSGYDYATVAYDAATGTQRWVQRYTGTGGARSLAVSPAGNTVFVTGESAGAASGNDYATVAYDAATGAQLWVRRYSGPGNGLDYATSVTVSPAGGTVFVTGLSTGAASGEDFATVAYDAATGTQLWVRRYTGPGDASASSVAVSPGGTSVFVTGRSYAGFPDENYATIAYNAATGAQLWVQRYNGPGNGPDEASSVVVSPAGGTVFVTGASYGATSQSDYATVAYDAATGAVLWEKRYNGPANDSDYASSVAVSPDGNTVYIAGTSTGATTGQDFATVAYNAATGAQLRVRRYTGPGNSNISASSVVVSPTTGTVFVAGTGMTTIAYSG
jgi:outer membrane protein assembly factor BamB